MKNYRFLLLFLIGMLFPVMACGQNVDSWDALRGKLFYLHVYGRYQDGRRIDEFRANAENRNKGERIMIISNVLSWMNCQDKPDGHQDIYTLKVEGKNLHLYNSDGTESNRLTLMNSHVEVRNGVKGLIIFTVDKYGWYREFINIIRN